jgi:hypothetical protein
MVYAGEHKFLPQEGQEIAKVHTFNPMTTQQSLAYTTHCIEPETP